ncbi:MAG: 50S ribosomal protein L35 [Candidatus Omnitrophica bacterium]|nr:50S ribosomal protein L35 [Candidatus Omnitrophota bacterium]
MPKLKTKKAFAKRLKVTKNKKVLRSKGSRRHLLSGRAEKRKRLLRKKALVQVVDKMAVKRALPYSF